MFAFMRNAREKRQEQLSAYLDGILSPAERVKVEALLARSVDARRDLDTLRATVALLRAAPRAAAPRSFALTPAMVRQPASSSAARPDRPDQWFGPRLLLPVASATALAFLTFTLVGGSLDLFTRGASTAQPDSTTALRDSATQRSIQSAATTSPPLAVATTANAPTPAATPPVSAFAPSSAGGPQGAAGRAQTEAFNSAAAPSPDASLKSLEAMPPQPATESFPWLALQLTAAALTSAAALALTWRWRVGRSRR